MKQRRVFFKKQLLKKKYYWIFKDGIKLIEFFMIRENSIWIKSYLILKSSLISSKNKGTKFLNQKIELPKFMKSSPNNCREKNKSERNISKISKIWYKKSYSFSTQTNTEKLSLLKLLKGLFKIRILTKSTGEKFSWLMHLSIECFEIKLRGRCKNLKLSNLLLKRSKRLQELVMQRV